LSKDSGVEVALIETGPADDAPKPSYRPASTCGIGRVAASQRRVVGGESLRVVDATVTPTFIRGNTNASVIANAERAPDLSSETAASGRKTPHD
jgi:choline dehydrogenase-like flavoprotein